MALKLSRRALIRGLGSIAVAFPALEIMAPSRASAYVGQPPKRFLISYGGTGLSADGAGYDLTTPDTVGAGYDLKRALTPLGELGVSNDVSIVSGLKLPWGSGSDIPPGGRSVFYHYNTVGPQVAGTKTGEDRDGQPRGPTADQVVHAAIADATHRVLTYRIQVGSYVTTSGSDNTTSGQSMTLSWKNDGDGNLVAVEPTFSPRLAYESLFTGFTPEDPEEAKRAKALLARRQSVLDLVDWSTARILPKLGKADKQRMERHFDEIRALENKIAQLPAVGGACKLPPHPGEDPPIGASSLYYESCDNYTFDASAGYSNEDLRGDILTDLIAMAFACDLSRSVSLLMTEWKCYMNMNQIAGYPMDVHSLSHQSGVEGVSDAVAWHVKQLARLTKKLRDTPEADGTTLLDHTAAVLLFEGGWGYDPEGGGSENSSHSTENMVALIAGRAGGLKAGRHVPAPDKHPASVVISAMNAVGATGGLGDLTEDLPELFA